MQLKTFRPRLEALEDRLALTTMVWIADGGGLGGNFGEMGGMAAPAGEDWFDADNWMNLADFNDHHIPLSTDNVVFNAFWSNVDCTGVTLDAMQVEDFTFTADYTGKVSLNVGGMGFTINGDLYLDSAYDMVNLKQSTLEVAGWPVLGVNGRLMGVAGKSGQLKAGEIWLAGGGSNAGTISFDVGNAVQFNSSYEVSGNGAFNLYGGGSLVVHQGKTFTISATGNVFVALGSGTPDFDNYGMVVKTNLGPAAIYNMSFRNLGDFGTLSVKQGELQISHGDSVKWAVLHDAVLGRLEVYEGATLAADALNSSWDFWMRRGTFVTIDVYGQDTAYLSAPLSYFGEDGGPDSVHLYVTEASNVYGTLSNPIGSIEFRDNCVTHLDIGSAGNDSLYARYFVRLGGTLRLDLLDQISSGTYWTIVRADASWGAITRNWGAIVFPPGPGWWWQGGPWGEWYRVGWY